MEKAKAFDKMSILFDFDGTIGDTETPAMEVAFWELAPYLPDTTPDKLDGLMPEFVRDNAGKAFEFMVEKVDEDRKAAGLSTISEAFAAKSEPKEMLDAVDPHRKKFGLKTFAELRAPDGGEKENLLIQQKTETVDALSKIAQPCNGVPEVLAALTAAGVAFCISTTSPKPRVPASITACKLDEYFPADKVHSGESDFDPPRFKPNPSVYLKAAETEGKEPANCIAVEDSGSGVGSASNAGVGLTVGYVGASHIPDYKKDTHAEMLMSGGRAENGKGAEIVISDMTDLPKVIEFFAGEKIAGKSAPFDFSEELISSLKQPVWVHSTKA
ncbi:unnamed protein product [Ectocarpus sp. 6 AP-2014]